MGKTAPDFLKIIISKEFPQVRMLLLPKNNLTEVTESIITAFPSLETLDISNNQIDYITPLVCNWSATLIKLKASK